MDDGLKNTYLRDKCGSIRARLILAHGAGAPMDSAFMQSIANGCSALGVEVVRFEFPYMAQRRSGGGKRPPNQQSVLLDTWQKVVTEFDQSDIPLFVGGKSMGGRIASLLSTETLKRCRGLICLGYPFHPQGKSEKLRISHLPSLPLPMLIVQGERDRLGSRLEVSEYELGERVQIHWLRACDHDLTPLKRSGTTQEMTWCETVRVMNAFITMQLV